MPTRPFFSQYSFCVYLAQFAPFPRSGYTASFYGLLLSTVSPNRVAAFPRLTGVVIASVCICIALLVLTPNKQSATWVFTTVTDGSGWGSKGFSFLLGYVDFAKISAKRSDESSFLSVAWTMTDYDGTTQ